MPASIFTRTSYMLKLLLASCATLDFRQHLPDYRTKMTHEAGKKESIKISCSIVALIHGQNFKAENRARAHRVVYFIFKILNNTNK